MKDQEFMKRVKEEMEKIGEEHAVRDKGDQFAIWFTTKILMEDEDKVVAEYHIGGKGDEKVDIGICDEDHDVNFVIQCKFASNPLQTTYSKDIVDEVVNAVERLKKFPELGNNRRKTFASKFNLSTGKYTRKIAVGFGRIPPDVIKYASERDVEIYDFYKIKDRYTYCILPGARKPPELICFSNIKEKSTESKSDFELHSFLVDLRSIFDLMCKFKDNIFEENLRYRLVRATKSKIGKDIQKTAEANPEYFSVLNNGITFIARKIDFDPKTKKITIYQPQIINGCQTCWAIYLAGENLKYKDEKSLDILKNGKVLIKAVVTRDQKLTDKTREATNSQNPIDARDLKSGDVYQTELRVAFDNWKPKILYEHKEGLLSELERRGVASHYRITPKTFRVIHNKKCGQYFLALLGKPGYAKAHPRWIFENDAYYETIFNVKALPNQRFNNSELGITASEVKVRTGDAKFFVEDIIFAHAIYNLAKAYEKKYEEKLKLFSEEELKTPLVVGQILSKKAYLKHWHFQVISATNYIVERLAKDEKHRKKIRQALIGRDINIIWTLRNLAKKFNLNPDKGKYVILDECRPSKKFKLFGKWISSLDELMKKIAEKTLASGRWHSWKDFDLSEDTHTQFIGEIENILAGPEQQRKQWFPLPQERI